MTYIIYRPSDAQKIIERCKKWKNFFLLAVCLCLSFGLTLTACEENHDETAEEMTREEISAVYKTVASEAFKKLGFDAKSSETADNKSEVSAMLIKSLPEIWQEETVAASRGLGFAVSLIFRQRRWTR